MGFFEMIGEARQGEKKKDAFEGYTGPVEEI
jgi:hypothetical protein